MILDDGGDATLLVHLGKRAEGGDTAFLDKASNEEEEVLFASIKRRLKHKHGWYSELAKNIRGVTEETTTGVHRLYQMEKDRKLLRDLNDGLAKIQNGTYGICEGTGKPISKARLEAQPWARYSIEYARKLERRLR